MKILYFNHYAGSMKYGMEYRPYYLGAEWLKKGHQLTVVAGTFSHVRSINPIQKKIIDSEIIDGIEYVWLKTPFYKHNGIKRVISIFTYVFLCFLFCFKWLRLKPDVIVASSTYPLDIFPSYLVSKLTRAKLIFEVHDLWPLSPMELGGLSKWHPFIFIMQIAENFAYKHSDKVVSMLPCAAGHMVAHGMDIKKFHYVPNGIREEDWQKLEIASDSVNNAVYDSINEIKKAGKFIVGYTGTLGTANAMHVLIEAALELSDEDVVFVMVGNGILVEELKKQAGSSDKIKFYSSVPKALIPKILQLFDIVYIGASKNPLYRFGISPNKLFDYMYAEKPIISSIEAGNDPVGDSKSGISIPAEDPASLRKAILTLKESSELSEMGKRGKVYILKNHIYKNLAEDFLKFTNY